MHTGSCLPFTITPPLSLPQTVYPVIGHPKSFQVSGLHFQAGESIEWAWALRDCRQGRYYRGGMVTDKRLHTLTDRSCDMRTLSNGYTRGSSSALLVPRRRCVRCCWSIQVCVMRSRLGKSLRSKSAGLHICACASECKRLTCLFKAR